jgi:hypothetical protein
MGEREKWVMLTSDYAPPLAEDWYMHRMEWVGQRWIFMVLEEQRQEEKLLNASEGGKVTDGIIEDERG